MSLFGVLLTALASVIEPIVFVDDPNDRGDVFVVHGLAFEQPLDFPARRGRHLAQRVNEGERHLVLAQVETRRLAGGFLLFAVVEQIIGDLERHSEILSEVPEGVAVASRA